MNIKDLSNSIVGGLSHDSEELQYAIDPLTIMAIMQLVSTIITAIQGCKKTPKQAVELVKDPGFLNKLRLTWMVYRSDYKGNKTKLHNIILDKGSKLSEQDFEQLFNSDDTK